MSESKFLLNKKYYFIDNKSPQTLYVQIDSNKNSKINDLNFNDVNSMNDNSTKILEDNSSSYTEESDTYTINKISNYSDIIKNALKSVEQYNNNNYNLIDFYPYFINNNLKIDFIPKTNKLSDILNINHLIEIENNLFYYEQYKNLKLLYSLKKDGTNFKTFYNKCEGYCHLLLVIKDNNNNIFGVYTNNEIKSFPNNFYGNNEIFLYSFYNSEKINVFLSTEFNENYIYSDYNRISFGCSDENFSLSIEKDFLKGYSKKTKTFNNLSLTNSNEYFYIINVELWTFE